MNVCKVCESQNQANTRNKSFAYLPDFTELIGSGGRDRTYDQLINSYISRKIIDSHSNTISVYIPIVKGEYVNIPEH